MKTVLVMVGTVAVLGACAPVQLEKAGANQSDFESDMQACEYDAIKYGSNSDPSMRTAVGAGIEQAMRQRDIKLACMKSKGWAARQ
jgi:hypothetical protein